MRSCLALDPGNELTAYAEIDVPTRALVRFGHEPNKVVMQMIKDTDPNGCFLACEMIASYGMPVGREVFETCLWIGRFIERWAGESKLIYRQEVKLHLCRSVSARDANIRQALLDRYGPGKKVAQGTKKYPGPLYGVSGDVWAALAVGTYYLDTHKTEVSCADSITL